MFARNILRSPDKGEASGRRYIIEPVSRKLPSHIERSVSCFGVKRGTGIIVEMDKRLRDRKNNPNDVDATNSHAIVVRVSVSSKKAGSSNLTNLTGWECDENMGVYRKTVDTWIDCDADDAKELVEVFADAMSEYICGKIVGNLSGSLNSRNGFQIRYADALSQMDQVISRIDGMIQESRGEIAEKQRRLGEMSLIGHSIAQKLLDSGL